MKASEEFDITVGEYENVTSRTLVTYLRYAYDKDGNLVARYAPLAQNAEYYQHPEDGEPTLTFYSGIQRVTSHSKSDSFGRKVFDELQLGTGFISRRFDYVVGEVTDEHVDNKKLKSSPTTQLVSRITFADGRSIEYVYDAEERITKVTDSVDGVTEYTYDALGQLLTETVNGVVVNTMTYDNYGNILTKNGVVYGYDSTWKDLLTSYNGHTITYDLQGNPLSYCTNLLEWEKGRQLKKLTKPDGKTITYTYNANGIRTGKTVGTSKHTYILDGTKILSESHGAITTYVHYDNEGSICGITYNSTPYYFLKNLQGDVIAITDENGEVVARYRYDAWGKVVSILDADGADISSSTYHIANVNPFRYRSYYYDTETGLYYLQSRYYDPETGRFVNADDPEFVDADFSVLTGNIYSYCINDCINLTDTAGYGVFKAIGIQLSLSFGKLVGGFELLWDTSKWKPYFFFFLGGGSRNALDGANNLAQRAMRDNLIYALKKVPKISIKTLGTLSKFSISVSFIAVFGNRYSSFPKDYEGWFTGFSLSIKHIMVSAAYGQDGRALIGSFGLGVTTSCFNINLGQTYYWRISKNTTLLDILKPLRSGISNKVGWLRLFTFLVI